MGLQETEGRAGVYNRYQQATFTDYDCQQELAAQYTEELKAVSGKITDSVEQIKADWMEMGYRLYRDEVELKSGVKEFLEELKK